MFSICLENEYIMHGYMGRILHLNLSDSKFTQMATEPYAKQYLGGRGIASKIYWNSINSDVKAFDPENHLILMTGPAVGTGAQAATRMSVIGKSPMTYPEGFCLNRQGPVFIFSGRAEPLRRC